LPLKFRAIQSDKPEDFIGIDDITEGEQLLSTERLTLDLEESVYNLLNQICWSYWQGSEEFPADAIREGVSNFVHAMRPF
jgi:hypothetical protein